MNLEHELVRWQSETGWTHAVTLTCHRPTTEEGIKKTAEHYLKRLDQDCFGKAHLRCRRGSRVGSFVSYGLGANGDHPHLHLSLVLPKDMKAETFEKKIKKCARRTKNLNREMKIEQYRDEGWLRYIILKDDHRPLMELCRSSRP